MRIPYSSALANAALALALQAPIAPLASASLSCIPAAEPESEPKPEALWTAVQPAVQPEEGEPAFCARLSEGAVKEIPLRDGALAKRLGRLKALQVGSVKLAGLAVGDSPLDAVLQLPGALGVTVAPEDRSCTFLMKKASSAHRKALRWFNLPDPRGRGSRADAQKWFGIVREVFDQGQPSFLSCAEKYGFIALGCAGMRHRGPTVFAMLLAFAGCTPKRATAIAEKHWQRHVDTSVRQGMVEVAYEHGLKAEHRDSRLRFQRLFNGEASSP